MASYCYEFPRPSVTVDILAFAAVDGTLRVLLVRRKADPFAGHWAIPGGFIEIEEPAEKAVRRELKEETGLAGIDHLRLIGVFGEPGRDPRGRTFSLVHLGVVRPPFPEVEGADDASEAAWVGLDEARDLAFDHDKILALGRSALEEGLDLGFLGLGLLPESFTSGDVKMLFRAFDRPEASASGWIRARENEGRIARIEGRKGAYRSVATRGDLDRDQTTEGRIGV